MIELLSLWKAPRLKLVNKQAAAGFNMEDFRGAPGQFPDGKAYFSTTRGLALKYAKCYGGGLIEVQISRENNIAYFQRFEEQCLGTREMQVAVPRDFLNQLNKMTVRRIWHHD